MRFQHSEGLVGNVVLHLAGVLGSDIAAYAEKNEKLGENVMSVVDTLGNVSACVGKSYMVVVVNSNKSLVLHLFKYDRYSRA